MIEVRPHPALRARCTEDATAPLGPRDDGKCSLIPPPSGRVKLIFMLIWSGGLRRRPLSLAWLRRRMKLLRRRQLQRVPTSPVRDLKISAWKVDFGFEEPKFY